jgi:cell division septum initiation protein DivIVA
MYLDEAVEIAEEKNGIVKYANFLIKRYEEVYEEKRKLEWQNERLREQVEFFERELSTEEGVKNAECRVQNAE